MTRWDPRDYEKSSSAQETWAKELIKKLRLKGDERILDIGCGDGKVSAQLAKNVPEGSVTGVDLSADMLAYAVTKYIDVPNLGFEAGDASRLKYDREFDYVVSFACLHWIREHVPVLQGIRRSLRSNGRIMLQFGGKGNAAELIKAADDVIAADWKEYFQDYTFPWAFYSPGEYRVFLKQAGLKAIRVELIPKDREDAGHEGLASFIRTTWHPYTDRVPEKMRKEFIDAIAEEYIRRNPMDSKGMVHIPMMRLEVEACVIRPARFR
ncbi:MAG: methyltransferase domain-containing protein [Candidatus Altiarchaeia archaeon]